MRERTTRIAPDAACAAGVHAGVPRGAAASACPPSSRGADHIGDAGPCAVHWIGTLRPISSVSASPLPRIVFGPLP